MGRGPWSGAGPGRAPPPIALALTCGRGLAGVTALVTGASRGIGLAIARSLVGAGARTFCLARSAELLARETESLGALAVPLVCELGQADDVARALDTMRALPGSAPDVLVQNAGLFALACTLPFYPFIMIAIWLEDGRPFFFGHVRETMGGREPVGSSV